MGRCGVEVCGEGFFLRGVPACANKRTAVGDSKASAVVVFSLRTNRAGDTSKGEEEEEEEEPCCPCCFLPGVAGLSLRTAGRLAAKMAA